MNSQNIGMFFTSLRGAPLDVATNAGTLIGARFGATEHGVNGRAYILAVNRQRVPWSAGVELSTVGERVRRVVQEKIRSARRVKVARDRLRFIKAIWKHIASVNCHALHVLWTILRMRQRVVAGDCHDGKFGLLIIQT